MAPTVLRVALLSAMVVPGGCNLLDGQSCTEIGCRNGAAIAIRAGNGLTAPLGVQLEIDGRRLSCPPPAPDSTCDPMVSVVHRAQLDCREVRTADSRRQTCVPNGEFEQVLTFHGTPARVVVTLLADGVAVAERTFDLTYAKFQPNGPDCEPTCLQASVPWDLP